LREIVLSLEAVRGTRLAETDDQTGQEYVNLRGVNFEGAKLYSSDLQRVNFCHANLQTADINKASLQGADLNKANLQSAHIWGVDLQSASLRGANLRGAFLREANLENADLTDANLQDARFFYANLQGAHLRGADLQSADLRMANLQNACIQYANLSDANVAGVRFSRDSRQRNFHGIRVATSYGGQTFKSFVQDQDYLEDLWYSGWWGRLKFRVWYYSSDCGRALWPWLVWSAFFVEVFALTYYWLGLESFNIETGYKYNWVTILYQSVVTFFSLGPGDIRPLTDWAKAAVMVEVILGYVMLGVLIAIAATKIARRA
jgi:uncharacterized protein YjbI with pentapeptide repeats